MFLMSLNMIAAWPLGIFGASDRRLVNLSSGKIHTNRSTKMMIFRCEDAHGVIAYDGIGLDEKGFSPNDWLLELAEKDHLFDCTLGNLLTGIGADLESRLKRMRELYGARVARHTFAVGVWSEDRPEIHYISNFEYLDSRESLAVGESGVSHTSSSAAEGILIASGGANPRSNDLKNVSEAINRGALIQVRARCVGAIRRVALGTLEGKGQVGPSVQWAFVPQDPENIEYGSDIVGGAFGIELPNLINVRAKVYLGQLQCAIGGPGMLIKDSSFTGGPAERIRYVQCC